MAGDRSVLGGHKPIHVQRREHDAFIDPEPPPIVAGGALVYLHGCGFVVGSLDQFETAMRRLP